MLKNVKCARCVKCGKEYEAVPDLTNCSCGGILDIIYDYDYIKAHLTKETLKNRQNPTMWRYRELLPVEETNPCGAGMTVRSWHFCQSWPRAIRTAASTSPWMLLRLWNLNSS